ncbi:MAG: sulfatase-like hydrolase/transferase, partial [Verrucomicrobiota bacterium]|nr:sulfatase-like hydrolase/transferase [Verrucomicrobiota bacterium]
NNGIEKNTLVLFTNDNGGAGKTTSGPLRGHKFGPKYEGHMRVPTLAWWPGKIPAGSVSSEIMATIDLLPTVANLCGQQVPQDRIIDGHDVSKILLGRAKAKSPHETLYYEKDGVRQGKWKLVRYKVKADRFAELYDLEKDLGEQNDLSKQYPEKVKALSEALDAHVSKIESEIRPAGLVENPKPLLAESEGVPTLLEWRRKAPPAKPNVVLMFIDDMGYGDIGPFGSQINQTPHLDRMAAEGLKFTDFYNASQNCTPSRAALLTGCYAKRVGMDGRVCFPDVPKALNPSEYTMARMFKDAGYATGCFGKWHLGHRPGYLPNDHGFDVYEGIPYSNDMWAPYDSINKKWKIKGWKVPLPWLVDGKAVAVVKNATDQGLLTQATTKAALKFIREQGGMNKPFFAYLPYAAVHGPRVGHPDFLPAGAPRSEANKTGAEFTVHLTAQIEELDAAVGKVFSTLKELGIAKNTIVLFMSDNGGSRGTSMGPLKGGKGSVYEGGPRTPFLIHWPESIPAGKVSHEIGVSSDLLPTFAKLCGGKLSGNKIDGRDLSDLFLNPDTAKSPHEGFAHNAKQKNAYRLGKWKMVEKLLFDLEKDLGETHNVAKEYPEVLKKLSDKNKKFFSKIESEIRPNAQMPDPSPIIDESEAEALPDLEKWLKGIEGSKK